MVQIITFAAEGGSPWIAASTAAVAAQHWLEQEQVHPSEIEHVSTDTHSSIAPVGVAVYSYTLTLVLHRLLPVPVPTWKEDRYAA